MRGREPVSGLITWLAGTVARRPRRAESISWRVSWLCWTKPSTSHMMDCPLDSSTCLTHKLFTVPLLTAPNLSPQLYSTTFRPVPNSPRITTDIFLYTFQNPLPTLRDKVQIWAPLPAAFHPPPHEPTPEPAQGDRGRPPPVRCTHRVPPTPPRALPNRP